MLSLLIFLPLAGGLLAALLPADERGGRAAPCRVAVRARRTLGLCDRAARPTSTSARGLQHVEDFTWISELGIHYRLGRRRHQPVPDRCSRRCSGLARPPGRCCATGSGRGLYYLMLALGETAALGAFCAQDLALFVLFFDLMLIPFYFLIGIWGGPSAVQATTKFVIYTLVGSLLMLAAAVATGILATPDGGETTFELSELAQRPLSEGTQEWIFLFFAAAFLVKMPAFPLHAWMPDAYRAAPTPVLAVLSGVLSKVGAYGFLRIVLPLFPDAAAHFQELLLLIALASILYGSVMAFTQTRRRWSSATRRSRSSASSRSASSRCSDEGAQGAVLQMVNHGLVVAPLFFIIALLAARAGGTRRPAPDGRARVARAGAGGAVPDRRAGDARDAGLRQLRRRVPDPHRRLQGEDRLRDRRRAPASCWPPST